MRVAFSVLTFNALDFDRVDLLTETLSSGATAFSTADRIVLDNGSSDGTEDVLREAAVGYRVVRNHGSVRSPGAGRNVLLSHLDLDAYDLVVVSDDDMRWHPDAQAKLVAFFRDAPEDVVLCSAYLEPEWAHNTVRGTVDAGGVRGLVRDNAPACAWAFRPSFWRSFGPLLEDPKGEDTDACKRVLKAGQRMVQFDLADHLGWGNSSLGNASILSGKPIDKAPWGLA